MLAAMQQSPVSEVGRVPQRSASLRVKTRTVNAMAEYGTQYHAISVICFSAANALTKVPGRPMPTPIAKPTSNVQPGW